MAELSVTFAGASFALRLYHFVLAFSCREYASVVESFEVLTAGLKNALWQAGGCPLEHRTDRVCRRHGGICTTQMTTRCATPCCSSMTHGRHAQQS